MLLRPISFVCGACASLFVVYLGRIWFFGYDIKTAWTINPLESVNPSIENVEAHANATVPEEVVDRYSIADITSNSTLGFEKILAINLPSRSDRRDQLTLGAALTGVDLEWIDGVDGADINRKAWPSHWNSRARKADGKNHTLGELGCWRSHMNALRRVIDEGWSSALIVEDDADWDINIKSQLEMLANKTRTLGNSRHNEAERITSDTPINSPYGNDWDLLWLGLCANPPGPDDAQLFPGEGDSQSHWVYYARGGVACTYGYAVTQKSARALMTYMLDLDQAVDETMSQFCGQIDCIIVWPELIGSHKQARDSNDVYQKDSDTGNPGPGSENPEKGGTRNVVNSAIEAALEKWGAKGPWQR